MNLSLRPFSQGSANRHKAIGLRASLRLALAATFLTLPLSKPSAQTPQTQTPPVQTPPPQAPPAVKRLPATEAAALEDKLDRRLLPAGAAELEFQPDQAVTLSGPSPLRLIPVRYQSSPAAAGSPPHFQCGLFLTSENHPDRFLSTFGAAWTATESCDGLDAAGLIPTPATSPTSIHTATYPTILLIYQAFTPAESFPEPVLLTWDEQAATYRPDPEQSQWLAQQKEGRTIPGARRLLAARTH